MTEHADMQQAITEIGKEAEFTLYDQERSSADPV